MNGVTRILFIGGFRVARLTGKEVRGLTGGCQGGRLTAMKLRLPSQPDFLDAMQQADEGVEVVMSGGLAALLVRLASEGKRVEVMEVGRTNGEWRLRWRKVSACRAFASSASASTG